MAKKCKNPYCLNGWVFTFGKKKKCKKCGGTGEEE